VLDPSHRFATFVLAAGAAVLLIAIALGERMGDRVLGQVTEHTLKTIQAIAASPQPTETNGPYGPDWKRSEALAAAGDPHFPDPRVPPQPLPTLPPPPKYTAPPATPTPNPNIPVWRQQPLPTPTPEGTDTPPSGESPSPGPSEAAATAPPAPSASSRP
jgi:hypothetical protein